MNDPKFVAETILVYNVKGVALSLWDFLRSLARNHSWMSVGVGLGIILVAGIALFASEDRDHRVLLKGPLLVAGAFIVSLLPNLLTVQGVLVMSDQCFLFLSAITV
jgi:hypothetical protein